MLVKGQFHGYGRTFRENFHVLNTHIMKTLFVKINFIPELCDDT